MPKKSIERDTDGQAGTGTQTDWDRNIDGQGQGHKGSGKGHKRIRAQIKTTYKKIGALKALNFKEFNKI